MSPRIAVFLVMACLAYGQGAVEAGLGASRAATSTAPAAGIGKSMSGLAGSLNKALKPAQKEASEEVVSAPTPAPTPVVAAAKSAPAKQKFEDAGGIEPGLAYDELMRRFGPASMAMTLGAERSLSYAGKEGVFQVTVQDGKVKAVEKPAR